MGDPSNSEVVVPAGLAQGAIADLQARVITAGSAPDRAVTGLTFKKLNQRHPAYDGGHWRNLRALYKGGSALLRDRVVMTDVFPPHRSEHGNVYNERAKRSFYIPYAGEIINDLLSTMARKPLEMVLGDQDEPPTFYVDFFKDVSPPGGETQSLHAMVRETMRTAMQLKRAWVRADLPPQATTEKFDSLAEQEKAGALRAFVVEVQPESVIDWEVTPSGELEFVMQFTESSKRAGLEGDRSTITKRWDYYDRAGWITYELKHKVETPPDDATVIPEVARGTHSFGRVPFEVLEIKPDLWVMEKLESPAREHFNKRSGLAWGELQSLLPDLYEFLAPAMSNGGTVINPHAEDDSRAINQARGQGFIQQRGHEDRAEFVGPESAPFKEARESCKELRDEMHRVTHQMALTIDNSASALGRSAESKRSDASAKNVVLDAFAQLARAFAVRVVALVSRGRGDAEQAGRWNAKGLDEFDPIPRPNLVTEATEMELVRVPSETFQRAYKLDLARALLPSASSETFDKIKDELERNINAEDFELPDPEAEGGEGDPAAKKPPAKKV